MKETTTIIGVTTTASLTVIAVCALIKGIDGTLLTAVAGFIGAIAGYAFGKEGNKKKG